MPAHYDRTSFNDVYYSILTAQTRKLGGISRIVADIMTRQNLNSDHQAYRSTLIPITTNRSIVLFLFRSPMTYEIVGDSQTNQD